MESSRDPLLKMVGLNNLTSEFEFESRLTSSFTDTSSTRFAAI